MKRRIFPTKYCVNCGVELVRKMHGKVEERTGDYAVRRFCGNRCGTANRGAKGIKHNMTPEGKEQLSQKTRERVKRQWANPKYRAIIIASLHRNKTDPVIRQKWLRGMRAALTDPEYRKSVSGERSVHWRGGLTSEGTQIRRSDEGKAWKRAVLKRDNYTCVWCGTNYAKDKKVKLQVDHIKPFAFFPELRFDIANGRVLCKKCHLATDTYGGRGFKRFKTAA